MITIMRIYYIIKNINNKFTIIIYLIVEYLKIEKEKYQTPLLESDTQDI